MRTYSLFFLLIALVGFVNCSHDNTDMSRDAILALHESLFTIDTHCDTPMRMHGSDWNPAERHTPGDRNSGMIDFPRMAEGGLDAQFWAVFVSQRNRDAEGYNRAKKQADAMIGQLVQACRENDSLAAIALTPDDGYALEKQGKRAIYIGLENGYPLNRDSGRVSEFYDKGVRYITLCHTRNNDICDSSTDPEGPEWNGLSPFGEQVVREMNRLGMIVDVSHISDSAFYDVLRISEAPVIASHSCCRAVCDQPRNLTDDMLRALAANGGVMQMCFLSSYLKKSPPNPALEAALDSLRNVYGDYDEIRDPEVKNTYRRAYWTLRETYPSERATLSDLMDHIDHVVQTVGIDYVGIGTDFDGGGGIDGCSDVSEMANVTEALVRRGYSKEEIAKIWGGNFMRVYRDIIDRAGNRKPA